MSDVLQLLARAAALLVVVAVSAWAGADMARGDRIWIAAAALATGWTAFVAVVWTHDTA